LASLEQELSLHTMSKKEYSVALKDVSANKDKIDKSISQLEKEVLGFQSKMEAFHKQEEEKKQRIFSLQDSMQDCQSKLNEIVSEKNEKQIAVARLDTKQEDLSNEVYQEMRASIESILKRGGEGLELEHIESAQAKIQKLKYKLTLVGGIDEEVIGEYKETRDRHDSLVTQLDDLKKALDNLETLVVELDDIMKKRRDKSFKKIQKEFRRYFSLLFDGGKADLMEVYGEEKIKEEELNLENTGQEVDEDESPSADVQDKKKGRKKKILQGIDITACPPGKKIKDIQALSGGERKLTSIALVCAILCVNPPPFSVLDEVEAALDESNTLRFNKILQELAGQTQFILITHNRATMHVAGALYGVTMGGRGVSNLLSVKLDEAKK
jgi:chromosome segregation protein